MDRERAARSVDIGALKKTLARRFGLAPLVMGLFFFLPAGTLDYWQAWAYMALLLVAMFLVIVRFLRRAPEVLQRRTNWREKEPAQKAIIYGSYPIFLAVFLLPGLDRRFGWSMVPAWLVVAADAVILAAYLLFARVMRENRFLSRVVEVDREHEVIRTGPYAVVRHPMYAAVIPMFVLSPLALGSYWALIPAAFIPIVVVLRILNEENVLAGSLPDYAEYTRQVKYRLIPRVW
ncbi:MAG: isoprenylcysteine carboxylmethyltransferase family protein [Candidatus Aminicenantes bacterium]|nr:isoprenylcysteine carboxylmethyltransferase family protein [Candidatus Aminicenantes bacterium]